MKLIITRIENCSNSKGKSRVVIKLKELIMKLMDVSLNWRSLLQAKYL